MNYYYPHFTDEKIKAQKLPKVHSLDKRSATARTEALPWGGTQYVEKVKIGPKKKKKREIGGCYEMRLRRSAPIRPCRIFTGWFRQVVVRSTSEK